MTAESNTFDRTVAELKQGIAYATKAQADASEKAMKAAKDFAAFNQSTLDAIIAANRILAAGTVDLVKQMAASAKAGVAETLTGYRALVTATSVKEGIELQVSQARAAAIWAVSESTRFAQAGIELADKAGAPLVAQAIHAADTLAALKG